MPDISEIIADYGPWAIFMLILVESFGVPVPGETALISAAILAAHDKMSIGWLLLAAWVAAVTGDSIGYAIGRFGGRRVVVRYGARIGITDARLIRVERFFARYGAAIVLVARFFAGLRQFNGIVAGISCMPIWKFTLYNAIGALLWVSVWGFGMYWFGQYFKQVLDQYGSIVMYAVIAAVTAAVLVFLILALLRKRRNRRQSSEESSD